MKNIQVELYGDSIGKDGNLARLIEKKECQLLLTIYNDDSTMRNQVILSRQDAESLIEKLNSSLNNEALSENGFQVV